MTPVMYYLVWAFAYDTSGGPLAILALLTQYYSVLWWCNVLHPVFKWSYERRGQTCQSVDFISVWLILSLWPRCSRTVSHLNTHKVKERQYTEKVIHLWRKVTMLFSTVQRTLFIKSTNYVKAVVLVVYFFLLLLVFLVISF